MRDYAGLAYTWVTSLTLRYPTGVSHLVQQHAPWEVNAMLGAFVQGRPVPEVADLNLC